MDCDGVCAEWDIRNEFETIDGMPVCSALKPEFYILSVL